MRSSSSVTPSRRQALAAGVGLSVALLPSAASAASVSPSGGSGLDAPRPGYITVWWDNDGGTFSWRVRWLAGAAPSGASYSYVLTSTTDGTSATGTSELRPNFMPIMTNTGYTSNTTINATFSYVTTNGVIFTGQLNGVATGVHPSNAVDLPAESIVKS